MYHIPSTAPVNGSGWSLPVPSIVPKLYIAGSPSASMSKMFHTSSSSSSIAVMSDSPRCFNFLPV
ncbi:hypothetical protein BD311DRAFT_764229 [Dichomitus squalens]|uniref:Uncharacterized protein n=1 Tax=Dichomitus squalens TaxID=114155 RepID=A0A4Q9MFV4_9APHY|nr:hypothetical protein BD311DRAFT_764229 [Dichomitus squalens]